MRGRRKKGKVISQRNLPFCAPGGWSIISPPDSKVPSLPSSSSSSSHNSVNICQSKAKGLRRVQFPSLIRTNESEEVCRLLSSPPPSSS